MATFIYVAVLRHAAGSAPDPAWRRAFADARCPSTNVAHRSYVHAGTRDTLEQYAQTLRKVGRRVRLAAGGRNYGEIIVAATPRGWALWEELRADGTSYTVGRPNAALRRYLVPASPLLSRNAALRTKQGFALGDPIAKVIYVYGNGMPFEHCGLAERAFAGPGRFGDWYAIYGADDHGKIAFLKTGDVSSGIRHLWQQSR